MDDRADIPRTNWSGNLHYGTDRVFAPESLSQVLEAVMNTPRIKPLGSRHCFNTIADSCDAQLSLRAIKEIEIDSSAGTVTVGAGVAYGELAPVLDRSGFALHNLASLPHITVAGAIATATHGSGVRNGNLATSVRAIELLQADGRTLRLSRDHDGQRFRLAVVHMGALGVVVRVTLDLLPRFEMRQVVYQNLSFDELEHNLDAILSSGYSVSLFTTWQGSRAQQVWIKDAIRPGESPKMYDELPKIFHGATLQTAKLHPVPGMPAQNCTEQMGSVGAWHERLPHFKMEFTPSSGAELQAEYFVARENAYAAIRAVEGLRDRIAPHLLVSEIRTVAADDLPMSMTYRRDSVALHFTWHRNEAAVRPVLSAIEAELSPFGGRPHWGKLFETPPSRLRELYPAMGTFRDLAAEMDPAGKFTNSWLERNILG